MRDTKLRGMFYLNNSGSRWAIFPKKENQTFLLVHPDGKRQVRVADFYEAFGNFAVTHFRVKGKRYCGFPRDIVDEATGLPMIPLETCRGYKITAPEGYKLTGEFKEPK